MPRSTPERGPIPGGAIFVGWLFSVMCALPVAYYLGIWIAGWEEPPDYVMQGASLSPLYSGAGMEIGLAFFGLVLVTSVVWIRVLVHQHTKWRRELRSL